LLPYSLIFDKIEKTFGWWFSLGTLDSSTTKTGRHEIAEILLKVALSTKKQSINQAKQY
jgi:hypothetical protein